ncbi:NUDIX domain-containing protein [Sulfidibacter corallicola]|uniref:NUDIX domain-containing protein n=1 Tax=Sulfidibacter corallicola TaxID=2818388 RepID=A0A8A4THZ8_SULCO|nr:NUDIX domain-containing protein [Sulfidibacter corallicola]QTD49117.1 NUDIX domain-containing protein [Sulfidibacter corallicola]
MNPDHPHFVSPGLKRVATLCVLHHHRNLMLLERTKEPHIGRFTPLGGKVDPNETPLAGAIRETYEETGIELDTMRYRGMLVETSPLAHMNWVGFVYSAEIEYREPPTCTEGTLKWLDFDELHRSPVPETDPYVYSYMFRNEPFMLNALFDDEDRLIRLDEHISGACLFNREGRP